MSEMIGMFLVSFFGALIGAFTAIFVFRWYQRMKQLKVLIELHKELSMKYETDASFAKLAQQLREEGLGND
jgi:uncharacterized membrane protein YdjX (TVP38/TMEM64 family)